MKSHCCNLLTMYKALAFVLIAEGAFLIARAEQLCPPPEQIAPCTCFKERITQRVTALCQNFKSSSDVAAIFNNNPQWNLQDVHVDSCTMSFIPASMLEQATFQSLNVSNSILDTLFDKPPKRTPELNIYLYNLRMLRGFEWRLFSNSSLKEFGATDTQIGSFGSSFRDHMPHDVERIWFEGTSTRKIVSQAFRNLTNLSILAIRGTALKELRRDMFPKPWSSIVYFDFSLNHLTSLPEDIFTEMPKLRIIMLVRNLFTTLPEKTFRLERAFYGLTENPLTCNCEIKWILSADPMLFEGTCDSPQSMKGKSLKKLTKDDFAYCT